MVKLLKQKKLAKFKQFMIIKVRDSFIKTFYNQ